MTLTGAVMTELKFTSAPMLSGTPAGFQFPAVPHELLPSRFQVVLTASLIVSSSVVAPVLSAIEYTFPTCALAMENAPMSVPP